MPIFYLVRHAHSVWTPDENRPLSAQGSRDAVRVADILRGYPVHVIYSSPAKRAFQTISPFAEHLGLPIHAEPDLRERKLGEEPFEDFFRAVEVTWQNPSFAHPGGESSAEAQKRGMDGVRRLQAKHPDEAIVLSTHGNLMALILQRFESTIDFHFWESLTMPDIYKLTISPSGKVEVQRLWQDVDSIEA